mgnify:CR=1 FL=1
MKILVLLAHPNEKSFNHAISESAVKALEENGHEIRFHDLYAEGFDPLLKSEELSDEYEPQGLLAEHCRDLGECDAALVLHPNWRDQPPAILKGWIDRVIRTGVAFRYEGEKGEHGQMVGLLGGKRALVITTSDCPPSVEMELGYPMRKIWRDYVFEESGMDEVEFMEFYEVLFSSDEMRKEWLEEVYTRCLITFPKKTFPKNEAE